MLRMNLGSHPRSYNFRPVALRVSGTYTPHQLGAAIGAPVPTVASLEQVGLTLPRSIPKFTGPTPQALPARQRVSNIDESSNCRSFQKVSS